MENAGVKTFCPNCKLYEARDGNYCSGCGSELVLPPPTLKCPKCHEIVRAADKHCINCGTELKIALPASPEPPALPELPGDSSKLRRVHRLYATEVEVIGPE